MNEEKIDITNIIKEIMKVSKTPAEAVGTCELVKLKIIESSLDIEDTKREENE